MEIVTTSRIIEHSVLNADTGELQRVAFREEKTKKSIRGGFRMTYPSYDEALLKVIKSAKDLEITIFIRELFTYQRVEVVLVKSDIANDLNVSEQKATDVIKRMINASLLKRVARGTYRLNPFMFLPFRADGSVLQKEWKGLP